MDTDFEWMEHLKEWRYIVERECDSPPSDVMEEWYKRVFRPWFDQALLVKESKRKATSYEVHSDDIPF